MTHNDTPTRWFSDALVNQLHRVDEAEAKDRGRLRYDLHEILNQISIVIKMDFKDRDKWHTSALGHLKDLDRKLDRTNDAFMTKDDFEWMNGVICMSKYVTEIQAIAETVSQY